MDFSKIKKISWAITAIAEFERAFDFIYLENPQAAINFSKQITQAIKKLPMFPQLGRLIPEIAEPRYREIIVGEYRILHEIQEHEIRIFSIFHSARNFDFT